MKTDDDIIQLLRTHLSLTGSLRRWATLNGFSPSFISFVLNGKSKVTPKLAAVFGYERPQGWQRKEKK